MTDEVREGDNLKDIHLHMLLKRDGESHLIHTVMRKCICFCVHKKKEEEEGRGSDALPVINGNSFLQFNHSRV